ncbi:hypothetical protein D3C81_1542340 [compost metagenome]
MIQQFRGEVADEIINILLIHNTADNLRNIRHTDDIPVVGFVALMIQLLLTARQNIAILGEDGAESIQYFCEHTINTIVFPI